MPLAYSLDKLLNNQQVLPYFIHFLDSTGKQLLANKKTSGNIRNIQFLMHLQGFYSSYDELKESSPNDLIKDARAIFDLFVDSDESPKNINFPSEIVMSIREKLPFVPREIFKEAQYYVYNMLEFSDFASFKAHSLYKKHEAEVLQSDLTLSDLIHIEVLLQQLLELISSDERSDLQFILACDAYEDEYSKSSPEQLLEDAMGIYDRYISLQASTPLPISSIDRLEIESSICQPSGTPDRKSFAPLRDKICIKLEKNYLKNLKESKVFLSYLEEVISLAETRSSIGDGVSPRIQTESDNGRSARTFSFSSEKEVRPSTSQTVTLAEVDSLGRYKPMFDDKRWNSDYKNNKIKNKFTNYLNKKAAKEEEEATEAALAIIQDVQRMVTQRSFD